MLNNEKYVQPRASGKVFYEHFFWWQFLDALRQGSHAITQILCEAFEHTPAFVPPHPDFSNLWLGGKGDPAEIAAQQNFGKFMAAALDETQLTDAGFRVSSHSRHGSEREMPAIEGPQRLCTHIRISPLGDDGKLLKVSFTQTDPAIREKLFSEIRTALAGYKQAKIEQTDSLVLVSIALSLLLGVDETENEQERVQAMRMALSDYLWAYRLGGWTCRLND